MKQKISFINSVMLSWESLQNFFWILGKLQHSSIVDIVTLTNLKTAQSETGLRSKHFDI